MTVCGSLELSEEARAVPLCWAAQRPGEGVREEGQPEGLQGGGGRLSGRT